MQRGSVGWRRVTKREYLALPAQLNSQQLGYRGLVRVHDQPGHRVIEGRSCCHAACRAGTPATITPRHNTCEIGLVSSWFVRSVIGSTPQQDHCSSPPFSFSYHWQDISRPARLALPDDSNRFSAADEDPASRVDCNAEATAHARHARHGVAVSDGLHRPRRGSGGRVH